MDILNWSMSSFYTDAVIYSADIVAKIKECAEGLGLDPDSLGDNQVISSSLFNGVLLSYVGTNLIKPSKILYDQHNRIKYDREKVLNILDVYIYLCNIYDKMICFSGFCNMIGYDERNNDINSLRNFTKILDKINELDNIASLGRARDSNQPILQLAYNNYRHNWNGQIKENAIKAEVKSLREIRENRLNIAKNEQAGDRVFLSGERVKNENP